MAPEALVCPDKVAPTDHKDRADIAYDFKVGGSCADVYIVSSPLLRCLDLPTVRLKGGLIPKALLFVWRPWRLRGASLCPKVACHAAPQGSWPASKKCPAAQAVVPVAQPVIPVAQPAIFMPAMLSAVFCSFKHAALAAYAKTPSNGLYLQVNIWAIGAVIF